ncbi:GDSL esterase/lipase At4g18970-like [Chenopodium quinoa]|uniref:GDSL esterase/lipase At4g18970-like n=1 Tax=Chenopodium quinoa TaxID=63459 RepID=UPI000B78B7D4|nr:GDSL esterase/lipase At4g18970-like [Chenopodium quinoa]
MLRNIIFVIFMVCAVLVNGEPKVPCYFIFGDSLSDVGNNNNLKTMAKANYPPYGVDFPGGVPTGRFTNNRTIEDYISTYLGFDDKSIVPYRDQMGQDILRDVNFASGSAGILMETGSQVGDRIWLDRQIQNYIITILRLQFMVFGPVSNYLYKCLYTVDIGGNDYINNYFLPQYYPSQRLYTLDQYTDLLISRYRSRLRILYNTGARMVAIFGLGSIGCIPSQIIRNNATDCVDEINQAANMFNTKLESLVDELNAGLPGAKFTLISVSALQALNPLPEGINSNSTCCTLRSDFQCEPYSTPCANRDLYAFFDGFHPTDVVNGGVAKAAYSSQDRRIANPMNINELTSGQQGKAKY